MEYGLLFVALICLSLQSLFNKTYERRGEGGSFLIYAGMFALVAALFFTVTAGELHFSFDYLGYSALFGLSYALTAVYEVKALSHGSIALTSLVISFSLMVTTAYGLLFLQEPLTLWLGCGLILLTLSLLLINLKKGEKVALSPRWILYVTLAFVGNGTCSTVQRAQQVAFAGDYKNEFMVIALLTAGALLLLLGCCQAPRAVIPTVKRGWYLALLCGIANGTSNLLVMILGNRLPTSILYPMISAGGLVLNYCLSRFLFREEITRTQTAGLAAGVAALVFFNL